MLHAGPTSAEFQAKFGSFSDLVKGMVGSKSKSPPEWNTFDIFDDHFPDASSLRAYDAFLITGSTHTAHENLPWILKTVSLIQDLSILNKKLVGICFGHQIIARALGGASGRAATGWEIGIKKASLNTEAIKSVFMGLKVAKDIKLLEIHQDQVTKLPSGATLLASSPCCPNEMYSIGNQILCIQSHPEFTNDSVRQLAAENRDAIPSSVFGDAMQSLDEQPDRDVLIELIWKFLQLPVKFVPPPSLKGVFAGSGRDALGDQRICDAILKLTGKVAADITVLYLGTATYDDEAAQEGQTARFVDAGTTLKVCKLADGEPKDLELLFSEADVIVVSGGNTLWAVDRWTKLGVHRLLREAMKRGTVLAGGSAGAICWFDAGHSDSMDPDTYKGSSRESHMHSVASWQYIRVDSLGFLPGLVCPHHDKVQSNGVLRATDFDRMLLRHPEERGLCIDHWAAIVVDGDTYNVISLEEKPGSVMPDGSFSPDQQGAPGVWVKDVVDGEIKAKLAKNSGKLSELLRTPSRIVSDPNVQIARAQNP